MDKIVLNQFEQELTEELLEHLRVYANRIAGYHHWFGGKGGQDLPKGEDADSIISRVVVKMLDDNGHHEWDPSKVKLIAFLKMSIKGEIGKMSRLLENRKIRKNGNLPNNEEKESFFAEKEGVFDLRDIILQSEEKELFEELNAELFCSLDDDQQLLQIAKMNMDNLKPKQIRKLLKLSERDYFNARKRLQRRMNEYREKYQAIKQ